MLRLWRSLRIVRRLVILRGSHELSTGLLLMIPQGKIVQHGVALGLGVAGMGGKNPEVFDDLNQTLFADSAVAGEAGYAMDLVLLGTADAASADEMLTYALETA
jgi:26S proteasome regulatory subunit N2